MQVLAQRRLLALVGVLVVLVGIAEIIMLGTRTAEIELIWTTQSAVVSLVAIAVAVSLNVQRERAAARRMSPSAHGSYALLAACIPGNLLILNVSRFALLTAFVTVAITVVEAVRAHHHEP